VLRSPCSKLLRSPCLKGGLNKGRKLMIVAEAGGSAGDVVATLGSGLVSTVTMTPGVKLEIRGGFVVDNIVEVSGDDG
jgi:hypothetical protein